MAPTSAQLVYRHLRQLTTRHSEVTDHQLVQRFVASRDETAFAALVERHAAMVLGVCRSILHNRHDAEDVFQAAFLVLARKAASIRQGASVGSWLYAVASRLAQKARARAGKRRVQELQAAALPGPAAMDELTWGELRGILHEEVSRLPEKYRATVVLCYWEGMTYEQAAKQLGCAKGTIKDRLERAREMLRTRLARRGLALSAAWFAASLSGLTCPTPVSAQLLQTTVRGAMLFTSGQPPVGIVSAGAIASANGVLQTMFLSKVKLGLWAALTIGVLAGGVGLATLPGPAAAVAPEAPAAQTKPPAKDAKQTPLAKRMPEDADPLPAGAVARLGTLRFRHGDRIQDMALSADGKSIVSASGKIVYVWDLATGKIRRRFDGHEDVVTAVACSPDGKLIASGSRENLIRLWDAASGRKIRQFVGYTERDKGRPPFDPQGFFSLLFTPDSRQLISSSIGSDNTLGLWDVATGEKVREFGRFGSNSAWSPTLSPDGKILAAVVNKDQTGEVRLWEVATGRQRKGWTLPNTRIWAVAFAPDGKMLAGTVGDPGSARDWNKPCPIKLWDASSGEEIRTLQGHKGIAAVTFAPDGKTLASWSSTDITARLWDVATGKELRPIGPDRQAPIFKLLFCPGGQTLVSYGQESSLRFWDANTGKEARSAEASQSFVGAVSFSPDSRLLASGSGDGLIQLWDTASKKEVRRFSHSGWLIALPFSPDGRLLASAGMFDPIVRIWETASGKEVRPIKTPVMFITCLAWSGDGKTLATWSRTDRVVHLWDAATGKELHRLGPVAEAEWVNSLAFSPDGRVLAAGAAESPIALAKSNRGPSNIVLLWAVDTGRFLRRLEEPGPGIHKRAGINCLAFSPDGRTIAAGGWDNSIYLWELATGQKRLTLKHGENVTSLAYSPDGNLLAAANNTSHTRTSSDGTTGPLNIGKPERPRVRLWDVTAEKELPPLEGHQGAITSLSFSPDGKLLASASNDTTVLLWDAIRLRKAHPPETAQLKPGQLESLWTDLADKDAAKAYRAIRTLASSPQASVDFLKRHLRPVAPADAKQVARLLADLESEQFADREKAMRALEKLGDTAAAELHKALAGKPSLEVKRRIEQLLEKADGPNHIRTVRAVEALERMGTPEARELCAALAGGAAGARLTREAQGTLRRIAR